MKLFRVYADSAVMSLLVQRNGFPMGSEFLVESGNHLLNISDIRDFASGELVFSNGPETIQTEPKSRYSPEVSSLLASWD